MGAAIYPGPDIRLDFETWWRSLRAEATKKLYEAALKRFFSFLGCTGSVRECADWYLSQDRNWFRDVVSYASVRRDKGEALPAWQEVGRILVFMEVVGGFPVGRKHRVYLRSLFPRVIRPTSEEDVLDRETVKKLIVACKKYPGMPAFLLLLATTGMRPGEALAARAEDFEDPGDGGPIIVHVENTKTGMPRVTFTTLEAWQFLKPLAAMGGRLFDMSHERARVRFVSCLHRLDLARRSRHTGRWTLRLHSFRKFFISQLKTAVPSEVVEMMAGHEGYLSGAYRRYTVDELRRWYAKGMHLLTFLTS